MTERAALDLSAILAQYAPIRAPRSEAPVLPQEDSRDPLRFAVPVKLGRGPLAWSTCMDLVPVERVCHDVNHYYLDLGVDWRATRKELREAYLDADGQESPRLTYVLKQLLDPVVREAYDRTPEGQLFPDDYTDARLKRSARAEANRRTARGQLVSPQEVLDEWGYAVLDEDEVDRVSPMGKDLLHGNEPWGYSYYAWKTSSYLPDEYRLQQWQELLTSAASRRGVTPELIIGMTAMSDRPYMLEDVNGQMVAFLSESTYPNPSIADDVIEDHLRISPHLTASHRIPSIFRRK